MKRAPMPSPVGMDHGGLASARVRDRMVERVRELGVRDARVLDAMRQVPRHLFVDEAAEASDRAQPESRLVESLAEGRAGAHIDAGIVVARLDPGEDFGLGLDGSRGSCRDARAQDQGRDSPCPARAKLSPTTFPRMADTRRRIGRDYPSSSACGLRQVRQPR